MSQINRRLENAYLLVRLAADGQLSLAELTDRQTGRSLLVEPTPFCQIVAKGWEGQIAAVESSVAGELLVRWLGLPGNAEATLHLTLAGPSLRWRLEIAGQSPPCQVCFPFLSALRLSDDSHAPDRVLDRRSFCDGHGRLIFRHVDFPLPVVRIAPDGRTLTLVVRQVTGPAPAFDAERLWTAPGLALDTGAAGKVAFAAELVLHEGGWPAAFDLFRERIRMGFDLGQYQRPEQAWYRDQIVQHFTFLYGREILNLETGQFEIDRFLDEAERDFGGYDGFLIWGVYPRIGVDERTQWDFHDDFPGGRRGLRAMGRRARERGVRFFIPYKPWDRSADLHGHSPGPDHELLARLVADVEADGVFLDTMAAISTDFRAALDRARPGVVFCSEGRAKGKAFEAITGDWDQNLARDIPQGNYTATVETMPGVDLWRFIFPEHRLFVISRHAVGADRIRITQRGFFSGMGWVVWQDIFGLVLSYSPEEAALLKKCRTIFREHREAVWGAQPTPLIDTLIPGVYVNEFAGEGKRFWTFYNETDHPMSAPVLQIKPRPDCHYWDVWNDLEIAPDAQGRLTLALSPQSVGAVVEFPRLLIRLPDNQEVTLARPVPGAILQVRRMGGESPAAVGGRSFSLGSLRKAATGPMQIRLVRDSEVLDQAVIRG
ncbi:MAG: hypothetical protein IT330_19370 [Anaerolineae bacterium]|nr:hypothetical protein [Anaerolineae bacterium]